MAVPAMRTEQDSLGEINVPENVYYGAQSARAIANFPMGGEKLPFVFTRALAVVKKAAAEANLAAGDLDPEVAGAIIAAADEVIAGAHQDSFVVDAFSAGAGVSLNMNMNEVLANRAEELLGGTKGSYRRVHPNDHVNRAQSSNDSIPTAIRLASLDLLDHLENALIDLRGSLNKKAGEFENFVKSGRTHLQDAVPITLGEEFAGYAAIVSRMLPQLSLVRTSLEGLNIGATAVGNSFNASPIYLRQVILSLRRITGRPALRRAENLPAVTASMDSMVLLSGVLRNCAIELTKIANDLRLLDSGPRTGLAEITLPPRQPGSSIMPGKVNPVIPEMLNQACFQVIGNDAAVALAGQAGQIELNVMTPVIARNLLHSISLLTNGCNALRLLCINGIKANKERMRLFAEQSLGLATALSPKIGYAEAAKVAQAAMTEGKSVKEVALARRLISEAAFEEILRPRSAASRIEEEEESASRDRSGKRGTSKPPKAADGGTSE